MTTVITVLNQGGSAGKTATAVTLAALLAEEGKRVLLVDTDQQGSATAWLGVDPNPEDPTVHFGDALFRRVPIADTVVDTQVENLRLIPGSRHLRADLIKLGAANVPGERLRNVLREVSGDYDVVLIDCPAAEHAIIAQALLASEHAITTVMPTMKEVEGVSFTLGVVEEYRMDAANLQELSAIVRCAVPPPNAGRLYAEVSQLVEETWPDLVTPPVRRSARVAESYSEGEPLTVWAPYDPVTQDYRAVRAWLAFKEIV